MFNNESNACHWNAFNGKIFGHPSIVPSNVIVYLEWSWPNARCIVDMGPPTGFLKYGYADSGMGIWTKSSGWPWPPTLPRVLRVIGNAGSRLTAYAGPLNFPELIINSFDSFVVICWRLTLAVFLAAAPPGDEMSRLASQDTSSSGSRAVLRLPMLS